MAVGSVYHDGVHASLDQGFHALFRTLAHTHRCANTQSACAVACGQREAGLLGDVFDGDQSLEHKVIVDDQQALQFVFVQQGLGLLRGGALRHSHQALAWRHDLGHGSVVAGFETQITPRHNADHFASFAHGET